MWLDVVDPHAEPIGHGGERAELIDAERDEFAVVEFQFPTAEVLAVGVARMRADGDAMLVGERERPGDLPRPTRMQPAADIRGRDERHQLGIKAGPLAQVRVEVDLHGGILGSASPT